jgi:hypothetical protein
VNDTNVFLFGWRTDDAYATLRDYSRAARFMTYIRDQIGIGVFKSIVQTGANGQAGLDAAFQAFGGSRRGNDIFRDWAIANILDDRTISPAYGYLYPDLPKAVGVSNNNPNVPQTTRLVQNQGVEYLTFKYGADLRARFTVASSALLIKAVEIGPAAKRVLEVAPGVEFNEPEFGDTYTEIHFVVINTDARSPLAYSYQASGVAKAVEQKWDETEPAGFLSLSRLDTICVTFDAVAGGRLDSIRVALRRKGTITGGVWQFTGVLRPTPLGKRLAYPITAATDLTPSVPYPIPYPNWRKVDLQSFNISTDQPFAVAFVVQAPDTPAVMITRYPGQSPYHSFTYLNAPGGGQQPDWFYLSADESNVWIYLIRAYVSFPTATGVEQTIALAPSSYVLAQNYPNPFWSGATSRSAHARQLSAFEASNSPPVPPLFLREGDLGGELCCELVVIEHFFP